jgi:hypothetical protein
MPTKDEIVRELIDWHSKLDPEMTKAYRFLVRVRLADAYEVN